MFQRHVCKNRAERRRVVTFEIHKSEDQVKSAWIRKDSNLAAIKGLVLLCPCWIHRIVLQRSLFLLQAASEADPFRSVRLCAEDCLEF